MVALGPPAWGLAVLDASARQQSTARLPARGPYEKAVAAISKRDVSLLGNQFTASSPRAPALPTHSRSPRYPDITPAVLMAPSTTAPPRPTPTHPTHHPPPTPHKSPP